MKDLIVEYKIGGHFNLKEVFESPIINVEFLNNELFILVNKSKKLLMFGFTIPLSSMKNRKKKGYSGYSNIIKLCLYKKLKNNYGGISKQYIDVKIIDKTKIVRGQEVKYIYVKIPIRRSIEIQLFKNLPNNLNDIKEYINFFLVNNDQYAYRYI